MTLPTYRPDAACPQCAEVRVSTSYLDGNEHSCQSTYAPPHSSGDPATCHYYPGPHLHRTCGRCGYRWAEAAGAPSQSYLGESQP